MKEKEDSSITLYWFLRIVTIPLPFVFAYLLFQSFTTPGFLEGMPEADAWAARLLGLTALLVFTAVALRLARISYGWGGVTVYRSGKRRDYKWNEVARVVKVPGWTPPMYRLSFRNGDAPVYFAMSWWNASIGFWSWDFTGFHDFAKTMIAVERNRMGSELDS